MEQKTGKQKALKVISIIMIVLAIINIIASGVLALFFESAIDSSADQAVNIDGDVVSGAAVLSLLMIVMIIGSIVNLIIGILGLRGANDPAKIGPYWVLCIIGIIINVIALIMAIAGAEDASSIFSCVLQIIAVAACFWLANGIKKLRA